MSLYADYLPYGFAVLPPSTPYLRSLSFGFTVETVQQGESDAWVAVRDADGTLYYGYSGALTYRESANGEPRWEWVLWPASVTPAPEGDVPRVVPGEGWRGVDALSAEALEGEVTE